MSMIIIVEINVIISEVQMGNTSYDHIVGGLFIAKL